MVVEKETSPIVLPTGIETITGEAHPSRENKIEIQDFSFYYGSFKALGNINMLALLIRSRPSLALRDAGNPPCYAPLIA